MLIQKIRPETFRRVCMSFDAWIVGFGLSTLVKGDLKLVEGNSAFLILLAVGLLDSCLALPLLHGDAAEAQAADPEIASKLTDDSSPAPVAVGTLRV